VPARKRLGASEGRQARSAGRGGKRSHDDSCGCAMGARFMMSTLIVSMAWYCWRWLSSGLPLLSAIIHVLVLSFLAAVAGKIVGIILFRYRSRKSPAKSSRFASAGAPEREA
jgi:hypothetical protein